MATALTHSTYMNTFQPTGELPENRPGHLHFRYQPVPHQRTTNWKASWTKISFSSAWHKQIALSCRTQIVTRRDGWNHSHYRQEKS